jgi:transaldolase/glucose-6-phosphate isomerase
MIDAQAGLRAPANLKGPAGLGAPANLKGSAGPEAHATPETQGPIDIRDLLRCHLDRIHPSDYFAILAYLEMNAKHAGELQAIRTRVLRRKKVATCVGFGPRFLHSTGQAYKGGPNTGVFLVITCDEAADLDVPGHRYTFGAVKAAQARGDLDVLAERGRRLLRVHLGKDVSAHLRNLREMIDEVLS